MQENKQKMRQMRAEGYSLREIADAFGLSIATVYQYVKDVNYGKRKGKRLHGQRLGKEEQELIAKMYFEGKKISEIARELGIHYQTAYRYVKKLKGDTNGKLDS